MQYDKSAQQRWRYQGVSEAPRRAATVSTNHCNRIQGDTTCNTTQYVTNDIQCNSTDCFKCINAIEYKVIQIDT